jgi:hypothetical protein
MNNCKDAENVGIERLLLNMGIRKMEEKCSNSA